MKNSQLGRACELIERRAKLSSDFGLNLLKKKVSAERLEEILNEVGVLKSGPNAGKPRGYIVWNKILEGGFDYQKGRILRGGCVDFYVEYAAIDGKKYKVDIESDSKSKNEQFNERKPEFEARVSDLEKLIIQCIDGISTWREIGDSEMVDFYINQKENHEKELRGIEEKLSKME